MILELPGTPNARSMSVHVPRHNSGMARWLLSFCLGLLLGILVTLAVAWRWRSRDNEECPSWHSFLACGGNTIAALVTVLMVMVGTSVVLGCLGVRMAPQQSSNRSTREGSAQATEQSTQNVDAQSPQPLSGEQVTVGHGRIPREHCLATVRALGNMKFNAGKHEGKTFFEVATLDPQYAKWISSRVASLDRTYLLYSVWFDMSIQQVATMFPLDLTRGASMRS